VLIACSRGGMKRSYSMSRSRGSVITPVSADAAAVSGLTRHTLSSRVPERPGKLRGTVRSESALVAGAWPMPMQPLQPVWCSRAPAPMRSKVAPIRVRSEKIWRDDGFTSKLTASLVWWPFTIAAAIA